MARPRQVSNEQMLEVAREVFLREGPGASTVEIARLLGLSQPALYKRFGSKRALMIAALTTPQPGWLVALDEGPAPQRGVREQLVELAVNLAAYLEQVLSGLVVLRAANCSTEEIFAGEVPWPITLQATLTRWLTRLNVLGRARVPHPEALAMSFIGALNQLQFMAYMTDSVRDPDRHIEAIVETLWLGMDPTTAAEENGHD